MPKVDSRFWILGVCGKHFNFSTPLPCQECLKMHDEDIEIKLKDSELGRIDSGKFTLNKIIPDWCAKRLLH